MPKKLPIDDVKNGRAPREKWMGITRLVKTQGYKSEILKKYGSIKAFTILSGVPYSPFSDFLNGRHYWHKAYAKICEDYLYGDKKQELLDLVYKPEMENIRTEIRMLFGTGKDMCAEVGYISKAELYRFMAKMRKVRQKKKLYWQIRAALAEKKLSILQKQHQG